MPEPLLFIKLQAEAFISISKNTFFTEHLRTTASVRMAEVGRFHLSFNIW